MEDERLTSLLGRVRGSLAGVQVPVAMSIRETDDPGLLLWPYEIVDNRLSQDEPGRASLLSVDESLSAVQGRRASCLLEELPRDCVTVLAVVDSFSKSRTIRRRKTEVPMADSAFSEGRGVAATG